MEDDKPMDLSQKSKEKQLRKEEISGNNTTELLPVLQRFVEKMGDNQVQITAQKKTQQKTMNQNKSLRPIRPKVVVQKVPTPFEFKVPPASMPSIPQASIPSTYIPLVWPHSIFGIDIPLTEAHAKSLKANCQAKRYKLDAKTVADALAATTAKLSTLEANRKPVTNVVSAKKKAASNVSVCLPTSSVSKDTVEPLDLSEPLIDIIESPGSPPMDAEEEDAQKELLTLIEDDDDCDDPSVELEEQRLSIPVRVISGNVAQVYKWFMDKKNEDDKHKIFFEIVTLFVAHRGYNKYGERQFTLRDNKGPAIMATYDDNWEIPFPPNLEFRDIVRVIGSMDKELDLKVYSIRRATKDDLIKQSRLTELCKRALVEKNIVELERKEYLRYLEAPSTSRYEKF